MIFGDASAGLLATPLSIFAGAADKADRVIAACLAHPERFLVSPRSGDPQVLVARLLTDPDNAVWEVWRNDTFLGILLLDRIVPRVDARLHLVFFDDELASKAALLNDFVSRCFSEYGLHRVTFEAPAPMTTLTGFVRRKLGFAPEGQRAAAYHDGARWHDLATLARFAPEAPSDG